jgi:hypothetical protein
MRHVVFAHHAMAVLDQIDQQIEDLRVEADKRRSAPQFTPVQVENVVVEYKAQNGSPISTMPDIQEILKEKSIADR